MRRAQECVGHPAGAGPAARDGQGGFTLLEFMFGMLIAILGLGGVLLLTIANARMRRVDQETAIAATAMRQKLEELRAATFASLPARNGEGFMIDLQSDGRPDLQPVPGDADGLPGSIAIATEATSGTETLYRVTVSVLWRGVAGNRHVALQTLVANRWGQ